MPWARQLRQTLQTYSGSGVYDGQAGMLISISRDRKMDDRTIPFPAQRIEMCVWRLRPIFLDREQQKLLALGTSGGGGFLPFPYLENDRSRTVSGRLHHSFEELANHFHRATPLTNAATKISTRAILQRLPSGNGPPPATRGGTQNNATTAKVSAGTSRKAIKA